MNPKNTLHKIKFTIPKKLLFVFLTLILSIYALGVMISMQLQRELERNLLESYSSRVSSLSMAMKDELENIQKRMDYVFTRSSVMKMELFTPKVAFSEMYDAIDRVSEVLNSLCKSSDLIETVRIYYPALNKSVSYDRQFRTIREDEAQMLHAYWENQGLSRFFFYNGSWYIMTGSGFFVNQDTSVLMVKLSNAAIARQCKVFAGTDQIRMYLFSESGYLMPDTSDNMYDGIARDLSSILPDHTGDATEDVTLLEEPYIRILEKLGGYPVWIAGYISKTAVGKGVRQFPVWLLALTGIAILDITAFLYLIRRLITKPIRRFGQAVAELEQEGIISAKNNDTGNEMDYLYQVFVAAGKHLKASMEQVYNDKLTVYQMEMKYLQAQVNPHFLYNSFFHLYRMSLMEDTEGVAEMSLKLSHYYRYITRSDEVIVPLEMEYQNIMDYADIQAIRFGDRIQVQFEELKAQYQKLSVPRFVLQPLMENAYYHGVEKMITGGRIWVEIQETVKQLLICTENNGTCSDEVIRELNDYLGDPLSDGKITALKNVKCRMMMLGGDLYVSRGKKGGFCVTVALPLPDQKGEVTDADTADC